MTEKKYYYSVLRYIPEPSLEEQIIIGIFYWFLADNVCQFIFPNNLERAKYLYPKANLTDLALYLNKYKEIANIFNARSEKISNANVLIRHLYGARNTVSLMFDEPKIGFYYNINEVLTKTNALYFANYEVLAQQQKK